MLVVSVVLRFWTPSPMWLDEALTVNIARAPLHLIPHLLRDDGAPPLYYVLLHFWMKVFGTSDLGARSLSGVIGMLTLPAAWVAGLPGRLPDLAKARSRRGAGRTSAHAARPSASEAAERERAGRLVAWTTMFLVATSPFAVYYDTEARMYSLVILLSTLGIVAYTAILRRPTIWNALALAARHLRTALQPLLGAVLRRGRGRRHRLVRQVRPPRPQLPRRTRWRWRPESAPSCPGSRRSCSSCGTPVRRGRAPADFTALVYTFTQFAGGNSDAGRALALVLAFLALLAIAGTRFGPPAGRARPADAAGSSRAGAAGGRDARDRRDRRASSPGARSRTVTRL